MNEDDTKEWIENSIGHSGARMISEGLKCNSVLSELDLYGGEMNMKNKQRSKNRVKNEQGWIDNNVGDEGVRAICDALKSNSSLSRLNVGANRMGESGAKSVSELLKCNSALTELSLSGDEMQSFNC